METAAYVFAVCFVLTAVVAIVQGVALGDSRRQLFMTKAHLTRADERLDTAQRERDIALAKLTGCFIAGEKLTRIAAIIDEGNS